ncbi:MAG: hypothetical protein HYY20_06070 [Candidatus Tectomicrobia bacterium]|uniref:Uncharacterized protein n=1 Tax=Tectimicrobiota bacterium TaxID=2528274 RepID=A0A932CNK3_UNCTE|nr:hypothetical protein [Candidatus Tectomicrobia bacterium]
MDESDLLQEEIIPEAEIALLARLEVIHSEITLLLKQREATLEGLKGLPKALDQLGESAWLNGEGQRPEVAEWLEFGQERREPLEQLAAELGGQVNRYRAGLKLLGAVRSELRKGGDPIGLRELVDHKDLARLSELYPPAGPVLEAVQQEVTAAYEATLLTYDREFREACARVRPDWQITGRFPSYQIDRRFAVSFKLETHTVQLESLTVHSFQIPTVVSRLQKRYKELWEGPFDPQKFLEELKGAYRRVLRLEGESLGQEIYLYKVHRELFANRQSSNFWRTSRGLRAYPEDAFGAELSRLLASGDMGHILTLIPVRQQRQSYYLYYPSREERLYFSMIKMME